ncbi:MAG TPA: phospholipase D-like domain-containing protein, partial [Polyangiaceae bacterium]|nr:phospholipase D-like domain-containing protein [Polyangiaceae bacterium]
MTLTPAEPTPFRIPRGLRRVHERFVAGNRIHLLHDGSQAFPAMLAAIDSATHQVLLEMYWFDSDRIGRRFAQALMRAAQRGVEVAVIYDAVGSFGADPAQFDEMQRAGVHVVEFNPVAPWKRRFRIARLTRRDHRKILVVDGRVGFTGGINIADEWLPEEEEGGGFRDDMVCVEGPAVWGFVESFQRTYRRCGGLPLTRTILQSAVREIGAGEIETRGQAAVTAEATQHVRVLGERFRRRDGSISRAYLSRMYRAHERIWLANSYFIPDRNVVRALIRAA